MGAVRLLDAFQRPGVRRLNQFGFYSGRRTENISRNDSTQGHARYGQRNDHLNECHSRPTSRAIMNAFLI